MSERDAMTDGWHTSSASGGGECVEVRIADQEVHVRDTKNRRGCHLSFTHAEWRAFLAGVRLGEFELPAGLTAAG